MKTIIVSCLIAFAALLTNSCNNNKVIPSTTQSVETIKTDSSIVTTPGEMFTCSMHNEVLSKNKGTCPKCGMKLSKQSLTSEQQKLYKEGKFLKSKEEQ